MAQPVSAHCRNKNPNVKAVQANTHKSRSNVRVDVDVDEQEALIRDMRRNPEKYQEHQEQQ